MKAYKDINNDSGVIAYDYTETSISVQFESGKIYEYPASIIGFEHLSNMKRLADLGDGLNAYIMKHPTVKNGYKR
ncbi:hypothetical protein Q9292_06490 [Methylophilus sp. VKM B-3414]|uniref:hypothetical protein n=1 Tax=Methylophilus sp. VKM B-3414 TaxID=3076121 RepID=UPI0028C8C48E|nr:hypothetical protein [Methylophilus sp. VKM B-3414]MDT7849252.1 hypothetical protein [Methylophilus sp. VKM B-3414]